MRIRLHHVITFVLAVVTVLFNIFSQAPNPLNGVTSRDIANRFDPILNPGAAPNYFLPANYVFSIWGLIYTALIVFAVYQLLPAQRDNRLLRSIAPWFWLSSLMNMGWLVMFHYGQFALSTVFMAVLLFSLIVIYVQIRRATLTRGDFWAISVPMSIYFGWITVAIVANVAFVGLDLGWDGFGIAPETWGVIMIVASGLIAGTVAWRNGDLAYAGVIIWAFVGLYSRYQPLQANNPAVSAVLAASLIMAGLVVLGVASGLLSGRRAASLRGART